MNQEDQNTPVTAVTAPEVVQPEIEARVELGPDLTIAPSQPVAQVQQAEPETVTPKKKGGFGKCLLVGCIVVLLCCGVTAGLGYYLFTNGGAALGIGKKSLDTSLTRYSSMTAVNSAINSLSDNNDIYTLDPVTGDTIVQLNESQLLAVLYQAAGVTSSSDSPNTFGVDIEKSGIKLEADLGGLFSKSSSSSSAINADSLKGVYASISVGVDADGKTLIVKSVSVGSDILDPIVSGYLSNVFQTAFNNMLTSSLYEGTTLKSVEFEKDLMKITVSTSSITVTPTTKYLSD